MFFSYMNGWKNYDGYVVKIQLKLLGYIKHQNGEEMVLVQ